MYRLCSSHRRRWCLFAMCLVCGVAGEVSSVVQHVLVPVVDSSLCNRLYEKIADKVKLDISNDMMCAGIKEGGRDACQVPGPRRIFNNCYSPC